MNKQRNNNVLHNDCNDSKNTGPYCMLGQPVNTPDAVTDNDPVDRVERELLKRRRVVFVLVEVQKLTRLGNRGAKRGCCADNCGKHMRRF